MRLLIPTHRNKAAILGDVCEALIGGIYRDGGYGAAHSFI